jgi:hypothetical protein
MTSVSPLFRQPAVSFTLNQHKYKLDSPGHRRDLDSTSPNRCVGIDGLVSGASFPFWTTNRSDTEICEEYDGLIRLENQPIAGVVLSPMRPHKTITQNFKHILVLAIQGGYRAATATGCSGSWGFNIKYAGLGGDILRRTEALEQPALLFERWFAPLPDQPASCLECADTFVAHLERI